MKRIRKIVIVNEEEQGGEWAFCIGDVLALIALDVGLPEALGMRCVHRYWRDALDNEDIRIWKGAVDIWRRGFGHWGYGEYVPGEGSRWKALALALPGSTLTPRPYILLEHPMYPCGLDECLGWNNWAQHRDACHWCRTQKDRADRRHRLKRIDLAWAVPILAPSGVAFGNCKRLVALVAPRVKIPTFGLTYWSTDGRGVKEYQHIRALAYYEDTAELALYELRLQRPGQQAILRARPQNVPWHADGGKPMARLVGLF